MITDFIIIVNLGDTKKLRCAGLIDDVLVASAMHLICVHVYIIPYGHLQVAKQTYILFYETEENLVKYIYIYIYIYI